MPAAEAYETSPIRVSLVPFYGGAKGQSLQISEYSDGRVTTAIIKTPENYEEDTEEHISSVEHIENPPLPSKHEAEDFGNSIKKIQTTALKIIKLQEAVQQRHKLTDEEEASYKENMSILNQSAESLAKIQEDSNPIRIEDREGLSAWFERKAASTSSKDKKKREDDKKKKEDDKKKKEEEKKKKDQEEKKKKEQEQKKKKEEDDKKKKEEAEKKKKEEEKRKEQENKNEKEEEEEELDDDTIAINLPAEDASVAEAKPVGLAVAGEGGVAASKPIATAVVGPGGLAIARPVGTAIAGVSPDQAMLPVYVEGYSSGSKPKTANADAFISGVISKFHQH